ncbi:MAG: CpaF family protein [Herpetosiphon sp.]|nr:CpaF family protein [Herpetosiphon sp.]
MSLLKRLGGASAPATPEPAAPASATERIPEYRSSSLTPLTTAPPPPPPPSEINRTANGGSLSSLAGAPNAIASGGTIGGLLVTADNDTYKKMLDVSLWVVDKIQASVGTQTQLQRNDDSERLIQERFATFYRQSNANFDQDGTKLLYQMVLDELFGFGPLEQLVRDDTVTEIMVNNGQTVYVEQKGNITLSPVKFASDDHVLKIIDRIIRPLGRRIDRKWPMVDARLPDGSRVNAIIPPCAIDGPSISIRKFSKKKLQYTDLINYGSMTKEMAEFLRACVVSAMNIVVSGGTGSGKTTLLNVLSNFIPDKYRICTIEDSAELQLGKEHVIRLESKPPDVDGSGLVTIRDLVKNSLRMRPDRIVVGEIRDGAALDLLQAMNTGHDGSMSTVHANTPRDAIRRLETLALMSGLDLPVNVIREQIASAVHVIVQQARLRDGSRKVVAVTEVQGMESGQVTLQDIFVFDDQGDTPDGKVMGVLRPTGTRPKFTPILEQHGFKLPPSIFGATFPGRR